MIRKLLESICSLRERIILLAFITLEINNNRKAGDVYYD